MKAKYHDAYALTAIVILALGIRIAYVHNTVIDTPVRGDAVYYLQYAKNLLIHFTFSKQIGATAPEPDSYWAPGYPAFLAAAIAAAKFLHVQAYPLILHLQAVLGALTAAVTFLIARLYLGRSWSLLPALFVSLSPHLVSLGANLLTETLYAFVLTTAIYVFVTAFRNRSVTQFTAAGVLFGLAWLVNPVMFFLPLFYVAAAARLYARDGTSLIAGRKGMVLCLAVFLAVAAAWQIRGRLDVPPDAPSSRGRLLTNLVIGTHSDYYRIWRANPRDADNPADRDLRQLQGSYTAFAGMLLHRVLGQPLHYLEWYLLDKPVLLWSWDIQVGQGDIYVFPVVQSWYRQSGPARATYALMKSLHYWLFGCAILGLYFLFRRRPPGTDTPAFLYISIVYISAVYVLTQAAPRYSVPLRPELYLCAVYFLHGVSTCLGRRRSGGPQSGTAAR